MAKIPALKAKGPRLWIVDAIRQCGALTIVVIRRDCPIWNQDMHRTHA
jgi:hypothetical protein